jgi:hypothetical protein
MSPTLTELFESGRLIRPSDSAPNLVHLVRAVATRTGVPDLEAHPCVQSLLRHIPRKDHVVFVLLDGLGMNTVRRMPADSFVVRSLKQEMLSVCPSTTACALTCIATGQYPNRHGVTGWFTHLPEFKTTAVTLPFVDRFSGLSLTHLGIKVEDVFRAPSLVPRMTHEPLSMGPQALTNTTYNLYSRGYTPGLGYLSIPDAITHIARHVHDARRPTYTHLYLPEVDSLCHKKGVCDDVLPLVLSIDGELSRLQQELKGKATIVLTADHGLIDVPRENQSFVFAEDPLMDLLAVAPSGDARMPIFHCAEGRHEEFAHLFRQRYGDRMALAPIDEVERLELLGPGKLSDTARLRFGDFIAFPFERATLGYHPPNISLGDLFRAVHAGLSPDEMQIPMCVG